MLQFSLFYSSYVYLCIIIKWRRFSSFCIQMMMIFYEPHVLSCPLARCHLSLTLILSPEFPSTHLGNNLMPYQVYNDECSTFTTIWFCAGTLWTGTPKIFAHFQCQLLYSFVFRLTYEWKKPWDKIPLFLCARACTKRAASIQFQFNCGKRFNDLSTWV